MLNLYRVTIKGVPHLVKAEDEAQAEIMICMQQSAHEADKVEKVEEKTQHKPTLNLYRVTVKGVPYVVKARDEAEAEEMVCISALFNLKADKVEKME